MRTVPTLTRNCSASELPERRPANDQRRQRYHREPGAASLAGGQQQAQGRERGGLRHHAEHLGLAPWPSGQEPDPWIEKDSGCGQRQANASKPRTSARLPRRPDGRHPKPPAARPAIANAMAAYVGRPIDRGIALPVKSPAHPKPDQPRARPRPGGPPRPACVAASHSSSSPRDQHQQVQGPDLAVVALDQAPVHPAARTSGNRTAGKSTTRTLLRASRRAAAMRWRMASSGMRPTAAAMFSRTWATLLVAGMAQVTAGCDTMNFSDDLGPAHAIDLARPRPAADGAAIRAAARLPGTAGSPAPRCRARAQAAAAAARPRGRAGCR